MRELTPIALEHTSFADYGTILDRDLAKQLKINQGTTTRFHRMAEVKIAPKVKGSVILSIFRGFYRGYPFPIKMMERHPLGTQAFFPLNNSPWLTVVAADAEGTPNPDSLQCFHIDGDQGVQYHRNVWHHPLLILGKTQDFLIVDRDGEGNNIEEHHFKEPVANIILKN